MQVLNSKRRETWKEQKHVKAGFEAGLEASRLWKLEQNNMTKKRPFLDLKRKKKQARKNGPSQ